MLFVPMSTSEDVTVIFAHSQAPVVKLSKLRPFAKNAQCFPLAIIGKIERSPFGAGIENESEPPSVSHVSSVKTAGAKIITPSL